MQDQVQAVRPKASKRLNSEEQSTSKRFWRYRWPDEIRDEVLGRLIELNSKRAREQHQGGDAKPPEPKPRQRISCTTTPDLETTSHSPVAPPPLFDGDDQ